MDDQQRLTPDERQELVAFLDGELDDQSERQLRTKIERSATARREVDVLKRTWEMLDFLPMPEAPTTFSQQTIELLAVADRERDHSERTAVAFGNSLLLSLIGVTMLAGAFFLGLYGIGLVPDANRELIADLPIIERYSEYRAAQDIQFIRMLRDLKTLDQIDRPIEVESP